MKIVFVNQSAGYLTTDLIRKFHEANYKTYLITGTNNLENKIPFCEIEKIPRYDNRTILTRILTWIWSSIIIYFKILFKYRKCKIVFYSNPPTNVFIHLVLKKLNFGYVIFDIYPDLIESYSEKSRFFKSIYKIWEFSNKMAYAKAKFVIYISEGMRVPLAKYVDESKLKYVGLWSNLTNELDNFKFSNIRNKFQIEDELLLVYSGNLGAQHPVEKIIDLAKIVGNQKIKFIICGSGSKFNLLEKEIKNANLENVKLISRLQQNEYLNLLYSGDFMFVTNSLGAANLSIPSKLFDITAFEKPILTLCSPNSELFNIVEKYNIGYNIDISDFHDFEEKFILGDLRKTQINFQPNIKKFNLEHQCHYQLDKLFKIIN